MRLASIRARRWASGVLQRVCGGERIASEQIVATLSFWYLAVFAVVIAVLYTWIGRPPSQRQIAAWILLIVSAIPLYGGGKDLLAEYRRSQDERVVQGSVVEKRSPSEADRSRRLRGRGNMLGVVYDVPEGIARLIATGSPRTWAVEYRYDCGAAMCRGRDVVTERFWSELSVGDPVGVRPASGHADLPRLDANSPWPLTITRLCLGAILLVGAGLASGRWSRAAAEYVEAPAVVTSVDPVDYGKSVRWRIQFAYFAPDGTAVESADEVYVDGVKPGDDCVAVYPPERPHLGSLRLLPRV